MLSQNGLFVDHQRRRDLDGAAAEADRAEHQHALLDASLARHPTPDRRRAPCVPGLTQATPATRPLPSTRPICGNRDLQVAQPLRAGCRPCVGALPARFSFSTRSMDASAAAQQTGLPVCVEVMLPAGCRSMTSGASGDGGERQRTGNAFAEQRQVGNDAVVLEAPERAGAAEAGLHFVADQQRLVAGAPLRAAPACIRRARTRRCRPGTFRGSRRRRSAAPRCARAARVRKPSNEVSAVRNPSGNGICTKPGSRLTIHSFSAGMPPACCDPSVRP